MNSNSNVVYVTVVDNKITHREVNTGWSTHPRGSFSQHGCSYYEGTYTDEEVVRILTALQQRYAEFKALIESGRCRTQMRGDTRFWYHPETGELFARQALVHSWVHAGFEWGALMIIGGLSDILPPGCEYDPIVWE
jgi:hypothetical protein